jgi:hypothetical protein
MNPVGSISRIVLSVLLHTAAASPASLMAPELPPSTPPPELLLEVLPPLLLLLAPLPLPLLELLPELLLLPLDAPLLPLPPLDDPLPLPLELLDEEEPPPPPPPGSLVAHAPSSAKPSSIEEAVWSARRTERFVARVTDDFWIDMGPPKART